MRFNNSIALFHTAQTMKFIDMGKWVMYVAIVLNRHFPGSPFISV